MPEFRIFLVDYTGSQDFTTSKKNLLANRLKNLFESVVAGHTDYTIRVLWQLPTVISANELICYYVLNRSKSIIKAKYHVGPGTDGYTRTTPSGESLSEIYYNNWARFPTFLADLTFHEFMHNKLDAGAASHVHDDTRGFGQEVLNNDQSDIDDDDPSTPDDERLIHHYSLTADNISAMFAALSTNVQQVLITQEEYNRLTQPRTHRR